ncbi:nucleotide exchange factor GrpE [Bifidobacterium goeldii]|uniref:Protein GrpE n=1 Tax=Bifidobacterium goeldii TaxID=2306975 RepID=A0A430FEN0_9BIFI|nr:nucleotide exchange factor GrpE [Bifidobacterium goeldii]RSX51309.1 nucleotide exchange factor GrpE [Bifidobacterium goeldii]
MTEFNKDDYLNDLPDVDDVTADAAASSTAGSAASATADSAKAEQPASAPSAEGAGAANAATEGASESKPTAKEEAADKADDSKAASDSKPDTAASADPDKDADGTLTPLGKAKKEAADYLEALQRERAEFINYRNRAQKEQERFRQHGIIDVLSALLPALDDIDRIREHSEMDDSFKAVAAKIDKAFAKFGVEKFGEKGEEFDPTKHEAILHKPDDSAEKDTVDTVVEAGYRIGDRVIRAARVVVASPKN